tara:strand:- start:120 stop:821 length:702 start_codon:yes stop_codon:yes gene_type:complete
VTEFIQYGKHRIEYQVVFLPGRRTLCIEVHPDQRVVVRAPQDCDPVVITERVRRRARWINRQLIEFERYQPRTPPRQYLNGETHCYLGRQYRLKIESGNRTQVRPKNGRLTVEIAGEPTTDRTRRALQHWYLGRARIVFAEMLDTCLLRIPGLKRPRLIVRQMRTRWGSLSELGNMTLNVRLIQAPRTCIEYVIVHELCHIQHHNHDSQFFDLLDRVMPDWRRRKIRLESGAV